MQLYNEAEITRMQGSAIRCVRSHDQSSLYGTSSAIADKPRDAGL